jgi:hypothetical protein
MSKYPPAIIHPQGRLRAPLDRRVRELRVDAQFVAINQDDEAAGCVLQIIVDASGLRDQVPLPDITPWVAIKDKDFFERSCMHLLKPFIDAGVDLLEKNGFITVQRKEDQKLYRLRPKAINAALAQITDELRIGGQGEPTSVRGQVH